MAKIVVDTWYYLDVIEIPDRIADDIGILALDYMSSELGHVYHNKKTGEYSYEVDGFIEYLNNEILLENEEPVKYVEHMIDDIPSHKEKEYCQWSKIFIN